MDKELKEKLEEIKQCLTGGLSKLMDILVIKVDALERMEDLDYDTAKGRALEKLCGHLEDVEHSVGQALVALNKAVREE